MFGDIFVPSECIRSCGPYCGMSYECIEVNSELVLRQDPITTAILSSPTADIKGPAAAIVEAWPTPEVEAMATASCQRVGAADVGARAPADFEAVSTADSVARAPADLEVPAWPTPKVDAMAAASCKRVGAAARPPADFEAVGNATGAPANCKMPAIAVFNEPAIAALPSNVFITLH
jgi:hypothetical protein